MRRKFAAAILSIGLVCIFASSVAAADSADVTRLMDSSGLTVQLTEMIGQAQMAVMAALAEAGIPLSTLQAIQPIVADVLEPKAFLAAIESEVQTALTAEEVGQMLAWFESDLGRKLTAAEEMSSTLEAQLDMMIQAESLMQDSERVAFAQELLELFGENDFGVAYAVNLTLLTTAGIWGIQTPDEPFNLTAVRVYLAGYERAIRDEIDRLTLQAYVYTYRDIDMDELNRYKEFLATPVASKFDQVAFGALHKQFELAALTLAERVADLTKGNTLALGTRAN